MRAEEEEATGHERLYLAAYEGDMDLLRELLADGADPNMRRADGSFPLERAALCDRTEAVCALLSAGARVDERDDGGMTSLMLACWFGCYHVVAELLAAGADPNAVSLEGRQSALHLCVREGLRTEAMMLLEAGARVDLFDEQGLYPIDEAIAQGHAKLSGELARRMGDEELSKVAGRWTSAIRGEAPMPEGGKLPRSAWAFGPTEEVWLARELAREMDAQLPTGTAFAGKGTRL